MRIELSALAAQLGAEIVNPPAGEVEISDLAALGEAGSGDLTFYYLGHYLDDFRGTKATAVLVARDYAGDVTHVPLLKVDDPSLAFDQAAKVLQMTPDLLPTEWGVHPRASVADDVSFDPAAVSIGANAVIASDVDIGAGSIIGPGVCVGAGSRIGAGCRLYPNVVLNDRTVLGERVILHSGVVLGADGFGFHSDGSAHRKIVHLGHVQVDDDVEIGANSTVDRARFGRTRIGAGTKIDNLVQIGHNVTLGKHCIIVAGSAIAGSARIGDHVTMAAQVGIAGHIEIGSFVVLGGRSGVTKSVPSGTPNKPVVYSGFPAAPVAQAHKEMVYPRRVPGILKRLKALEEK